MLFSTSALDWALIALYFAFLAAVWLRRGGTAPDAVEYLLAGRRITLPAFVATLVATWYGGILGVGEYSYRYGISNWLVFGAPYYIGALLFAWLFARRAREARLFTLPDLLDRAYGRGPALIGAGAVFLFSAPAAYVLMLGTLFAAMAGLPLVPCVIAAAILSLFYIQRGGLRAVVLTDQVQFALMFAGFALLLGFLVVRHGGLSFLTAALPATHFTWHGGNPPQAILVWYFIALSALVDPGFWQRACAARDPVVARRGVLISVACWIVFDFLTTCTGLYARAVLPSLADPVFAFPELAKITLPPVALGLFYLAMIATVMSTVDSYGFIAGSTIGRDVLWRLRGGGEERLPRDTRLGLWIAAVFATAVALANPSVVGIWHTMGSITTPTLLLPAGTALLGRGGIGSRMTAAAMIAAFAVSLGWVLAKTFAFLPGGGYPLDIEPIHAGLATSLAFYAAGWMLRAKRAAGVGASGSPSPVAGAPIVCAAVLIPVLIAAPTWAQDSTTAAPAETLRRVVTLPPVEVNTARAGDRTPVASARLDRRELRQVNWGQDTPMALATLPGVYAYSDAGNGIGYSYLSIRGFPQRRISVLINGVPLNDPESHEVYWIDHPDLLASTSTVQVQRGVGSALYGAASLGGSVSVETSPFGEMRRGAASFAHGSYDTRRLMLEMDSGRLAGGWNLYGRYSRIESDGYRDQSDSKLWSYTLAARKVAGRHSFRVNLYGGPETTHLAYLGVSRDILNGGLTGDPERDRRFNPLTYQGERDRFFEPHYELIHAWAPAEAIGLTQTFFFFDGEGFYDEQRFNQALADYRMTPWATFDPTLFGADSLLYYANDGTSLTRDGQGRVTVTHFNAVRRRWIANRHFGWIPRARFAHPGGALTVGGELRWHDGRHVGTVISGFGLPPGTPPDAVYYDFHPRTFSGGLFLREEWSLRDGLHATADFGWRRQQYAMRGDRFGGVRFDQPYDLALPRLGMTWDRGGPWRLFAAVAHARREPALRDLYDGEGLGAAPLFANGEPLVRPERVMDYEVGGGWRGRGDACAADLNLFRMDFRDELVYAGQFNTDLGYPILGNAARSVHQGMEMSARARVGAALELTGNLTASDNRFVRYREVYGTAPGDTVVYDGNTIGFFPALLGNFGARVRAGALTIGADLQHVGRMYLDHTEDIAGSIAPRSVLNASAGWQFASRHGGPSAELSLRVFNALDARYETGGYSYFWGGTRYTDFIPAATRNVLAELRLEF